MEVKRWIPRKKDVPGWRVYSEGLLALFSQVLPQGVDEKHIRQSLL